MLQGNHSPHPQAAMPPSNGIVHTGSADGSSTDREYLILEEVRAKVFIVDGKFEPKIERSRLTSQQLPLE